jgi:uncharacterized membrane protein YtjA (UPF0391 family)
MTANFLALALCFTVIALIAGFTLYTGASPMPTSRRVARCMFDLLPDRIDGPVFELGSAWGNLAFAAADRFPDQPVQAFEISPVPWLWSRLRLTVSEHKNLRFHLGDFFRQDLSGAALVICYLHPKAMEKLKEKLEAELRPGTLVLCNTFAVHGWAPLAETTADDMYKSRVYLYRR